VTYPNQQPAESPRPAPPPGGFRPGPPPGGFRPGPPSVPQPQRPAAQEYRLDEAAGTGQIGTGQIGTGQIGAGQTGSGRIGAEGTGHPAVDAVLQSLANAATLAPSDQIAEYEAAHQVLQETLASIDR
jgi:hypothetical protein